KLAALIPVFATLFAGTIVFRGAARIACDVAVGFLVIQLGIIAHDAGHRSVSRRPWFNEMAGHFGMTIVSGLSFIYWRHRHGSHHRYSQDEERDPDTCYAVVFSVHERAAAEKRGLPRLLMPFQAAYFWPVASLYSYSLRWDSVVFALRRPDLMRVDRWLLA